MASNNLSIQQVRTLLALVLKTDKQGVVDLLNINGVQIGMDSPDNVVTVAFLKAIKDSATFRAQTVAYLENWLNQNKQGFLGNPHVGFGGRYHGFFKKKARSGQPSPGGHFSFIDDKKLSDGGQPAPGGHFYFIDDMEAHPNPRSSITIHVPRNTNFVEQPRSIIDFASEAHDAMRFVEQPGKLDFLGNPHVGFNGKRSHIKRNFVEQPRDIIDFVTQPQDIMAYSGSPKKMKGGFLRQDGDPVAVAMDPNQLGVESPITDGTSPVGTVTGPPQVTLQVATETPAQYAAALQQAQAMGIANPNAPAAQTPASSTGGSFLGGLFSSGNISKILTTGLNAYSTNLTAKANATSEQNALALEAYKTQQSAISAQTASQWPAWATVAIAIAGIGAIALVIYKMNKARKAGRK